LPETIEGGKIIVRVGIVCRHRSHSAASAERRCVSSYLGGTTVFLRRLGVAFAVICSALPAVSLSFAPPAQAVQTSQAKVVSDDPVNWTPHVLDGRVKAIVQVGDTVVLGGLFTQVSSADGRTIYDRTNLVAFNATTGAVSTSFAPEVDGEVTSLAVAEDNASVFVGGFFDTVNGTPSRSLARIRLSDGALVPGFTAPKLNGRVKDLRLSGGRLFVAGTFGYVADRPQAALATVDPKTGAFDPFQGLTFSGPRNGGVLQVMKMDVTPDGSRLVAIGNFTKVEDQSRPQIAVLDLTGQRARLADWHTDFYSAQCSSSFDSYMRDLDIAPDGSYFVVSTTGSYAGGPPGPCDTTARFETGARGSNLKPTWVNYTGGDTTYAVAVTGTAVYVGGHFRWQNNPHRGDKAGPGAVAREGIAALDPTNGLPLRWNPGRTKGVGVFDMLATSQGLWVGSDTDRIGNWEYHARIAFFPLAGGTEVPRLNPGQLPGEVYVVPTGGSNVSPRKVHFDGQTVGDATVAPAGGLSWDKVRGAFMLGDQLYTGWSDGSFTRRSFDGSSFGLSQVIDTADQLVVDTTWHNDVASATGMFVHNGRLYYTRSGSNYLYYRYFTPESLVVGAQRLTASASITGVDFSRVAGMFLVGDQLYFASSSDGILRRVSFRDGAPVPGTVRPVSGPTIDGLDWRSRAIFVLADRTPPPNEAPVAVAAASCEELSCDFTSVGSHDPDGRIVSYHWSFGDGTTATGPTPSHTFSASGTYRITLTVTDDNGAIGKASVDVTVTRPNQEPTAAFTVSCDGLSCTVDASQSRDPDGTIASYSWNFGDGSTGSGRTASHTYAREGGYTIRLTVTDNDGGQGETTQDIRVAPPATSTRFVAQAGVNANLRTHQVTIPGDVAAGDLLLLFMTVNSADLTISAPSGGSGGEWAVVGTQATSGTMTRVWKKVAAPTDAGATVTVTLSDYGKADLAVVAYRGPNLGVRAFASAAETEATAAHTTPQVDNVSGAWLVSYWADKSSATTAWTPPAGQTVRRTSFGSGSGRVSSLVTDSGATVGLKPRGGLTATADAASRHATMWSILIGPAS